MSKAIEYMSSHQSATGSKWKEEAKWRRDNERWLRYARNITVKVMKAMDEQCVTQAMLAERMGCSQQYVSNLLKGSTNMTLETIARIEDALGIDIFQSTALGIVGYSRTKERASYLNDTGPNPYGISE